MDLIVGIPKNHFQHDVIFAIVKKKKKSITLYSFKDH